VGKEPATCRGCDSQYTATSAVPLALLLRPKNWSVLPRLAGQEWSNQLHLYPLHSLSYGERPGLNLGFPYRLVTGSPCSEIVASYEAHKQTAKVSLPRYARKKGNEKKDNYRYPQWNRNGDKEHENW